MSSSTSTPPSPLLDDSSQHHIIPIQPDATSTTTSHHQHHHSTTTTTTKSSPHRLNAEYLSERYSKQTQRYLTLQHFTTQLLVRFLGSIVLVAPYWDLVRWHLALGSLALALLQTVLSILSLGLLISHLRETHQKLIFFSRFVHFGSLAHDDAADVFTDHDSNNNADNSSVDSSFHQAPLTDSHDFTYEAQAHASKQGVRGATSNHHSSNKSHMVPAHLFEYGKFCFSTKFYGIYLPMAFEFVTMVLFFIACVVRAMEALSLPPFYSSWLMYAWSAPLPLLVASSALVLSLLFRPLDLLCTLQVYQKMLLYNEHAILLHNRCMEQFERDPDYGGAFVEQWTPCTHHTTPVLLFEHIHDLHLAVSLESAPFSTHPINLPWLYITTINASIGKEYRVILPIRIQRANPGLGAPFAKRLYHHLLRHWYFFRLAPVYDALDVYETIELLRVIQRRRPDLFDKLDFLVDQIESRIDADGWKHHR